MLANVGIKKYIGSKVIKAVIVLAVIGLTVIFITENNTKVTPRKKYKVSTKIFRVITVRKKLSMLKNVEVRC